MKTQRRQRAGLGFTLIELMITVVVIAILAAIAYPTYISQVRKSRRTDAKSLLMKAANREQQYYNERHQYTADLGELGLDDVPNNEFVADAAYQIAAQTHADNQEFDISATARGDQVNDRCIRFNVDETGRRTSNNNGNDSADCWQ